MSELSYEVCWICGGPAVYTHLDGREYNDIYVSYLCEDCYDEN